jgi:hypothetical protein
MALQYLGMHRHVHCRLLAAGDPVAVACKLQPVWYLHPKNDGCLLPAGLVALAAGLVRLASTALAAVTLHAAAAAPASPAHLSLLVWISVCAQQDMA